ncbi:hypothetical protein KQH82_08350 [bacterium]|nr:hypothetical protein [bacterium]
MDDEIVLTWSVHYGCGNYVTVQGSSGVDGNTYWASLFTDLQGVFCLPMDFFWGGTETIGTLSEGQYYFRVEHDDWIIHPFAAGLSDTVVIPFYVYDFSVCESGNVDGKEGIDLSDLIYLTNYLFSGGPEPPYMAQANVNGVDEIDLSDLIYLVNYLFNGGPAPIPCE